MTDHLPIRAVRRTVSNQGPRITHRLCVPCLACISLSPICLSIGAGAGGGTRIQLAGLA